jgi:hypothetical protein
MLQRCEKYEGMSMPKIAFASILLSNWSFMPKVLYVYSEEFQIQIFKEIFSSYFLL